MCKINLNQDDLTYSCCGSPEYMAPETKHSLGYNYSVDFYTMGAIIYEMVIGVPPYYQNSPLEFPPTVSDEFV
jgi:serum/glucocorticoid-regulated kinase 2